jgi:alpha-tubulin suppressor-like RCC1 family protein
MCWGDNQFGQAGNGTFATPVQVPTVVLRLAPSAIAAGQRHTCAIDGRGFDSVCWGDDTFGQLGDGQSGAGVSSAQAVTVRNPNGAADPASALAAGDQHSCALNQQGNVQCWGDNTRGQLGIGSTGGLRANPNILGLSILDAPALAISAGGLHTCAVMQDNSARCWGDNTFGQIGNGAISNSPVNRPATVIIGNNTLPNVMQIAAGERHTCALIGPLPPGIVACWGNGPDGELGRPGTTSAPVLLPQLVLDSSGNIFGGATDIAAGSHHTCARINDGTVQCWGSNSRGQLGQAVAVGANSVSPVTVTFDAAGNNPLSGVAHIAAGQNHTCATLAADGVRCWGDNSFGQLGASTAPNTKMSATPVAVTGVCTCPGLTSCNSAPIRPATRRTAVGALTHAPAGCAWVAPADARRRTGRCAQRQDLRTSAPI